MWYYCYIQNNLEDRIKFPKSYCDFMQWLKLSNPFSKTDSLLIGYIYIPPEGSKYTSVDAYLDIEADMLLLSEENMEFLLHL